MRFFVTLLVAFLIRCAVESFVLPVSSRVRDTTVETRKSSLHSSRASSGNSVSADLISKLAEVALKLRLPEEKGVKFQVQADTKQMLTKGRVGPVTVRGRGWKSPRGLSCRLIEATVSECELDMSKVIANKKLVLLQPAMGGAMIAFDATDFGNFLTHPKVNPPQLPSSQEKIAFLKEDVVINPETGGTTFYGTYDSARWQFDLRRDTDGTAIAKASPCTNTENLDETTTISTELSQVVSDFFNKLLIELDGTFLSYQDMTITKKGASPSLLLKLGIKVVKFPAPNSDF